MVGGGGTVDAAGYGGGDAIDSGDIELFSAEGEGLSGGEDAGGGGGQFGGGGGYSVTGGGEGGTGCGDNFAETPAAGYFYCCGAAGKLPAAGGGGADGDAGVGAAPGFVGAGVEGMEFVVVGKPGHRSAGGVGAGGEGGDGDEFGEGQVGAAAAGEAAGFGNDIEAAVAVGVNPAGGFLEEGEEAAVAQVSGTAQGAFGFEQVQIAVGVGHFFLRG